jgi:hypothetical protein
VNTDMRLTHFCPLLAALLLAGARSPACGPDKDNGRVNVTVVVVLANSRDKKVDDRLTCLAREIRKKHKDLTGFSIGEMGTKPLGLGDSASFPLVEGQEADVTVKRCTENPERFCLKVRSPGLVGEITYSSVCGKYFPIDTNTTTKKDGDRVFLAIMVEPCPKKKK